MKESSKYTVAQPSKQLHIESLGHAKYHLSPASVFAAQWQIHHMLPQMEEKPVTVWLSLSEKSKFESLRILTACSELQTLPYLPCLLQFADKCLSHKWKEGKQPPCRQLFRVFYREAQALCQKEMISIWLFRRSKQQLLGKKCTWDHPRWRFLARQESGIMACHRGNLQTKHAGKLSYAPFWSMQFFQLDECLSTSRLKSLECKNFLCCPNSPRQVSYFAVSTGTLLRQSSLPNHFA